MGRTSVRQGNSGAGVPVSKVPGSHTGPTMMGTITRLIPNRGFGFIRGSEDGLPRFMHCKSVIPPSDFDTMREGQAVSFVSVDTGHQERGGGLRAEEVRLVK